MVGRWDDWIVVGAWRIQRFLLFAGDSVGRVPLAVAPVFEHHLVTGGGQPVEGVPVRIGASNRLSHAPTERLAVIPAPPGQTASQASGRPVRARRCEGGRRRLRCRRSSASPTMWSR